MKCIKTLCHFLYCILAVVTSHALGAALLTLANIVAAVSCLKRLSRVPGAAAKLHLWALVSDPKHCGVAHVAATETVERKQQLQDVIERYIT